MPDRRLPLAGFLLFFLAKLAPLEARAFIAKRVSRMFAALINPPLAEFHRPFSQNSTVEQYPGRGSFTAGRF